MKPINYSIIDTIGSNAIKKTFEDEEHDNTSKLVQARITPYKAETGEITENVIKQENRPKNALQSLTGHARQTEKENTTTDHLLYAKNIMLLSQTAVDITRGLEGGQDAKELLLIAIKGIDLARGTTELYDHTIKTYSNIYTDVLHDKATAKIERQQILKRLERLEQAQASSYNALIARAITEHKERLNLCDQIIEGKTLQN